MKSWTRSTLTLVNQAAHLRLVVRGVTDHQFCGLPGHELHHAIMDGALDEDAAAGRAVLAGVVEDGHWRCGRELLQVSVGKHDVGAFAAQLERDLLHVVRGQPHDLLAGCRLARERDLADARMRGKGRTGRAARAGHDVDDARRKTCLECEFSQPDCRKRCPRRGLEDARVTRGEGRPKLPRGHVLGEVPGHDHAHYADRLAQREVEAREGGRDRLAEMLVRGAGVVLEHEAHRE